MAWRGNRFGFPEYLSVAERRDRARATAEKIGRKQKRTLSPVGPIDGSKLARSFWGKAWCGNLEAYSDYASRLPRGRSYAKHGAVIDLQISAGAIAALVSGSVTYKVNITIQALPAQRWAELAAECTTQIDSLVDLLRGTLPPRVMQLVTRKEGGLFPGPSHISFECTCPDWAGMCKHIAATLYGVGIRLDEKPELLFALRGVDHADLVGGATAVVPGLAEKAKGRPGRKVLAGVDLSALFGIEMESSAVASGAADESSASRSAKKARDNIKGRKR